MSDKILLTAKEIEIHFYIDWPANLLNLMTIFLIPY